MKRINKYGVSRSRDKKGKIVKRELKDYTMCIHASVEGGRETMWVLIAEVYEEDDTDMCDKRESDGDWHNSEHNQRFEIGGEISNSITSVLKDNYIFETNNHFMEEKKEKTPRPEGKGWCRDKNNGKWFRIRKLTPRECFRLMDVRDGDFDKLLATDSYDKNVNPKRAISDSQLYKMAGNSIVVSCLDLIFENLFFPKKREGELF